MDCPVCGAEAGTCTGETHYAGPGVQVLDMTQLQGGVQVAEEQIWLPDENGVLRLRYPIGSRISEQTAVELNIVDGKLRLRDNADVAPTEKARRRAQDKAMRAATVENKAEVLSNG